MREVLHNAGEKAPNNQPLPTLVYLQVREQHRRKYNQGDIRENIDEVPIAPKSGHVDTFASDKTPGLRYLTLERNYEDARACPDADEYVESE